jgi:hypothetical protein
MQTTFYTEPEDRNIIYADSIIKVKFLKIEFGPYQYNQSYLDLKVNAFGDWIMDGEVRGTDHPYFQNQTLRLESDIIDQWGTNDDIIVDAVFAHYGLTRKQD